LKTFFEINNKKYDIRSDVLTDATLRENYFGLAKTVFGLDLHKWHEINRGNNFIPYVIFDGDLAVSSAAVVVNDIKWKNTNKRYVQLSTVMTLPGHRNLGLNRRLIEHILNEWRDKCDAVYLYANDSVVNYYPKFNFMEFTEYDFTIPIKKRNINSKINNSTEIIKLNLFDADDFSLIAVKFEESNPFADLTAYNPDLFFFHCHYFLKDNIYYFKDRYAVILAKNKNNQLIIYDVFAENRFDINEIIAAFKNNDAETASLGFTPNESVECRAEPSAKEDNHLFVLSGKENIFANNKIKFPLLSRA